MMKIGVEWKICNDDSSGTKDSEREERKYCREKMCAKCEHRVCSKFCRLNFGIWPDKLWLMEGKNQSSFCLFFPVVIYFSGRGHKNDLQWNVYVLIFLHPLRAMEIHQKQFLVFTAHRSSRQNEKRERKKSKVSHFLHGSGLVSS